MNIKFSFCLKMWVSWLKLCLSTSSWLERVKNGEKIQEKNYRWNSKLATLFYSNSFFSCDSHRERLSTHYMGYSYKKKETKMKNTEKLIWKNPKIEGAY